MFDFDRSLFENAAENGPLICAHRGSSTGNIACNTMAAFKAALMQGADMVELDVTKSRDGDFFVFHPGKERAHLRAIGSIGTRSANAVKKLRFVNQDDCHTFLGVERLEDVLDFLRGKCYINVDKFWSDIPGITGVIRRCGVEKQVTVKTSIKERYLKQIADCASDLMFIPTVHGEDNITASLRDRGINCVGAEVLFKSESDPVASPEYLERMHKNGMVVFANAIVYDSRVMLSAGHSDDASIIDGPEVGWGWLAEHGFDIIQTDWCGDVKRYLRGEK